jgi:UDP-perosamine 4-acetyltransferase
MTNAIVVVGAGGHAKVCIELLQDMGEEVAWCVGSDDASGMCVGVPVLAGDYHLERLRAEGFHRAFVALGANRLRVRLGEAVVALGYELVRAVSPRATVSPSAKIGKGVAVMAGVVINADSVIGDLSIVNTGATVDHDNVIGEGVHIAPQCALAGNVTVSAHAFLGIGTRVVPERSIGAGSILGAGSVVIDNIEPGVTAVGVPARIIKRQI